MHLKRWLSAHRTALWTHSLVTDKDRDAQYFDFCRSSDLWIIRVCSFGLLLWRMSAALTVALTTALTGKTGHEYVMHMVIISFLLLPSSVMCLIRLERVEEWVRRHAKLYYYGSWFIFLTVACSQLYVMPRLASGCVVHTWDFVTCFTVQMLYPGFTAWLRLLWLVLSLGIATADSMISGTPLPTPTVPLLFIILICFCFQKEWARRCYFLVVQEVRQEIVKRQASEQEALRARDTERRSFALLSHEIRTPLGAVLGYIELLEDTDPSARQSDYLAPMKVAADLLNNIIKDLLDHFKLQEGKFTLCPDFATIRKTFQDGVAMLQGEAITRGLTLQLRIGDEVPEVGTMDTGRVQQMLNNLVSNAIKFTPTNGTVAVTVGTVVLVTGAQGLKVEVSDTGVGVPREHQASLFQPFAQAGALISRRYGGTGLGLSIVRLLAELMGGTAGFSSQPGQGSCFWFTLKLTAPEITTGGSPAAIETLHRRYKLLVVDDTPMNLRLVSTVARVLGIRCEVQESGANAIEYIKACSPEDLPDLVLMDCWMPNMSGFEATEGILGLVPDMPVLALTADSSPEMEDRAMACGMLETLQKPVLKSKLIHVCNKWGNRRQPDERIFEDDEVSTYSC